MLVIARDIKGRRHEIVKAFTACLLSFVIVVFFCGCAKEKEEEVTFADANLESAVRDATGKPEGPILKPDLERLGELAVTGRKITDLRGIERCTSLRGLELWENRISDITPLSKLTNLDSLTLQGNQLTDISPVSKLTKLVRLQLGFNKISDISPVSTISSLLVLKLEVNRISDLSPLRTLGKLQWLEVGYNRISDVGPLSGLARLQVLSLYNNQIREISPLSKLTMLKALALDDNHISDISALAKLKRLAVVYLENNRIKDISPLELLADIGERAPMGRKIKHRGRVFTVHLGLSNNRITEISPLVRNSGIGQGDGVDLRGNPLSDDSINKLIPQLEQRGVRVLYDKPEGAERNESQGGESGEFESEIQGIPQGNEAGCVF